MPVPATLPATAVFEFRATGNADNGGIFDSANPGGNGVDYTLQDAAQLAPTDLAMVAGTQTLTSATGGFTAAMENNWIRISSGTHFTLGRRKLVTYVDTNTFTICSDATDGTNATAGVGNVGGAISIPKDGLLESAKPGNIIYIKGSDTFTFTELIAIAQAGTAQLPIRLIGYNTTRGDTPTGANRPTFAMADYSFTSGLYWSVENIIFTTTSATAVTLSGVMGARNCKVTQSSGSDRNAIRIASAYTMVMDCEASSAAGDAINITGGYSSQRILWCYLHDSVSGITTPGTNCHAMIIMGNVIEACSASGIDGGRAYAHNIINNTIDTTVTGIGDVGASVTYGGWVIFNNIISNMSTISIDGYIEELSQIINYNDLYNNTADYTPRDNDNDVDPGYTSASDFSTGANVDDTGFGIRLGVG